MRLGLRTKIVALFTAMGVLFAASGLTAYRNNMLLTQAAHSIASSYEVNKYAGKLDSDIEDVQAAIKTSASLPDSRRAAVILGPELALSRHLIKVGRVASAVNEASELEALGALAGSSSHIFNNLTLVDPTAVDAFVLRRHRLDIERSSASVEVMEHLSEGSLASLGTTVSSSRRTQTLMLGLMALLALLAMFLVVVFSHRVVQPLAQLGAALRRAAAGQMDVFASIDTGDEIEEAAKAFNKLVSRLREEEALAATLQEKLLPSLMPSVPGLAIYAAQRQARLVGGDWYDYHVMDGTLAFSVADACGKGMAGALLSTVAMTSMRSQVKTRNNLCCVLEQVNLTIESRLGGDKFVTLLTGYIDPRTGIVTMVNCGHEQPLVYRAATKTWEFIDCASTLPLGISFEHFRPRQVDVPLAAGDKLLLYTDGLHDVRDQRRRFLEMPTILSWMAEQPEKCIQLLIDDLLQRAVDYAQGDIRDDITILGMEYAPVTAASAHQHDVL